MEKIAAPETATLERELLKLMLAAAEAEKGE